MDYSQEQADEIEALDSIYTGYFDKLTDAPPFKVSPGRMRPRSADGVRSLRQLGGVCVETCMHGAAALAACLCGLARVQTCRPRHPAK